MQTITSTRHRGRLVGRLLSLCLVVVMLLATVQAVRAAKERSSRDGTAVRSSVGRDLFQREWLANDPRSHDGDGLGPVFNDTSCAACHNLGGAGGGGPVHKNVEIITAATLGGPRVPVPREPSLVGQFVRTMFGLGPERQATMDGDTLRRLQQMERDQLAKVHPGFRSGNSVVLHRFSTNPRYDSWRQKLAGAPSFAARTVFVATPTAAVIEELPAQASRRGGPSQKRHVAETSDFQRLQRTTQEIQRIRSGVPTAAFTRTSFVDGARVTVSQRNPISLFGAGYIDSVPDAVIEAAAKQRHQDFPEISGRVSRLKDGRIGRFGWKAQTATLYDFTMTACAVELGLQVPDHPQSGTPLEPKYMPKGYDLDQQQCNALVAYVRSLPAPEQAPPENASQAAVLETGSRLFASVGCAACHTPKLGEVDGIYSDLLVHDMGPDLVDTGEYGAFTPDVPDSAEQVIEEPLASGKGEQAQQARVRIVGATQQEWRTAPLWGCRDSSPYLHDGRAQTLQQAIALHGGEAAGSAQKFFMLPPEDRGKVIAFLKSLTAPNAERLANAR